MFKYVRTLSLGAALLLILSVAVAAASKVAIIKVNSGTAKLDGKTIAKAQMASQGQKLVVSEGSKVRIQLLGSKDELVVTGPAELTIDKKSIKRGATEVSRNSASVAADIGSKNTASASITRGASTTLTSLDPVLPPRKVDGEYIIDFRAGDSIALLPEHTLTVNVDPLDGDGPRVGHTFKDDDPLVSLQMSPDFKEGKGYQFTLIYNDPGVGPNGENSATYTYRQTFRILTPDQKAFLKEAEGELLEDYRREKDILPLLRLASLYQEFDQNKDVYKYLKMSYDSGQLNNEEQWTTLKLNLNTMEQSFKMPVPLKKEQP